MQPPHPSTTRPFDAVVVGLGAIGSATLMQLARRGLRVLGLDRYDPPHTMGSSHGETRMTRLAVGEGDAYVPFALRSHEIWRELEAETGKSLLVQCGALIVAPAGSGGYCHGRSDFLGTTVGIAQRFGIRHQVLDGPELAARFPQFQPGLHPIRAYWEPDGGYLHPERCIAAQLGIARRLGAEIRTGTVVAGILPEPAGATVVLIDGQSIPCGEVVLAAGAWSPDLAPAHAPRFTVYRQTMHWLDVEDPAAYAPERFPAFIFLHGDAPEDYFYGAPIPPGTTGVKLGIEQHVIPADPDTLDRSVAASEPEALFRDHVQGRLVGIKPDVLRSIVCMYTTTPDAHFVVAPAAGPHVLLASCCSGHGFKHSAALGEALARQVAGEAGGANLAAFAA